MAFEKTIHIDRPPHEVDDFVSDPANDVHWRLSIMSSKWETEPPVKVGSRIRSVQREVDIGGELDIQGEYSSEIAIRDPPNQFSARTIGGPAYFVHTVTVEPDGKGAKVTIHFQADTSEAFKEGPVGNLVDWMRKTPLLFADHYRLMTGKFDDASSIGTPDDPTNAINLAIEAFRRKFEQQLEIDLENLKWALEESR